MIRKFDANYTILHLNADKVFFVNLYVQNNISYKTEKP